MTNDELIKHHLTGKNIWLWVNALSELFSLGLLGGGAVALLALFTKNALEPSNLIACVVMISIGLSLQLLVKKSKGQIEEHRNEFVRLSRELESSGN
ncbi:MAG: hypothetical protein KC877_04360 [Candidatus Kaiserbacteria bacterium]|nr:hypothetical protein [Candidatus Kaiserbacteria bacterium]MCB9816680.1 hypothetical protein [Candidatus Nomurabacteria bacterium]